MRMMEWTVKFEVSERWVADGFEITNELATAMIEQALYGAFLSEFSAKVTKAPSKAAIKKVQAAVV